MAPLLGLPAEVLLMVIEQLQPADIIPFALCSRLSYQLAFKRVQNHQHLKERFRAGGSQSKKPMTSPIDLLREINRDPDLAWYAEVITIDWRDLDNEYRREDQIEAVKREDNFRALMRDIPILLEEPMVRARLEHQVEAAAQCDLAALLVLSLPNLQRLKIGGNIFHSGSIAAVWNASAARNRHNPTLPKLNTVEMHHWTESATANPYEMWPGVLPWLAFVSVRTVICHSWIPQDGPFLVNHWLRQDSYITSLTFYECIVDEATLLRLLAKVISLREFRYINGINYVTGPGLQARRICATLVRTQSFTLQRLEIEGRISMLGRSARIKTLKPFKRLTHFGGLVPMIPTFEVVGYGEDEDAFNLGDFFPETIQSLTLRSGPTWNETAEPLRINGLDLLPRLRRLLCVGMDLSTSSRAELRRRGLVWTPTAHEPSLDENDELPTCDLYQALDHCQ